MGEGDGNNGQTFTDKEVSGHLHCHDSMLRMVDSLLSAPLESTFLRMPLYPIERILHSCRNCTYYSRTSE